MSPVVVWWFGGPKTIYLPFIRFDISSKERVADLITDDGFARLSSKGGLRQCHRLTVILGIVRRSPQPSESVCRKCTACKKHLLDHQSSWKYLSALLCPSTLHWSFHFHFKFIAVPAGITFVNCLLLICCFGGVSPCRFGGKSLNSIMKFMVSLC